MLFRCVILFLTNEHRQEELLCHWVCRIKRIILTQIAARAIPKFTIMQKEFFMENMNSKSLSSYPEIKYENKKVNHKSSEKSNSPERFTDTFGKAGHPADSSAASQLSDSSFMKKVFSSHTENKNGLEMIAENYSSDLSNSESSDKEEAKKGRKATKTGELLHQEIAKKGIENDTDDPIYQEIVAADERIKKEQGRYIVQRFSNNILVNAHHNTISAIRLSSGFREEQWKQLSADVSTVLDHRNGKKPLDDTKQLVPIFERIEITAKELIKKGASGAAPKTATEITDEFNRVRKKYIDTNYAIYDTEYAIDTMGINIFTGEQ